MYNKCYKEVICVQRPKGTLDVYGLEGKLYDYIYEYTSNFMKLYNYDFIKTPTFESTDLFYRGVGETTDVVNKETYDFIKKIKEISIVKPIKIIVAKVSSPIIFILNFSFL